jgi:3-deoxy-7-phosphoheptulonate synthase
MENDNLEVIVLKKLLVSRESGGTIKINIRGIEVGGKNKVIFSGPCSVENDDTMLQIAQKLKSIGVHILRGGAFKPRTSPYDFQGLEFQGLKILYDVGKTVDMPVATEIMDTRDVEYALDYTDIIQIGSRNMYNYSLLKEVAKTQKPILLKRGISATIKEWVNAAEYIISGGNSSIIMCERGIRTFEGYTRNTLDLNAVAVLKSKFRLPVIVDPSHGTGIRELVLPMSLASIAAGADGLMIESHIKPDCAASDAKQTVDVDTVKKIICSINKIESII